MSLKVDLYSTLNDPSGPGTYAKNLAKVLSEVSDLNIKNINLSESRPNLTVADYLLITQNIKPDRLPDVAIHAILPPLINRIEGAYNIAVLSWETSKLPDKDYFIPGGLPPEKNNWVKQLNLMDEVWCTSKHTLEVLKKSGFKKKATLFGGYIDTDFWTKDCPDLEQGLINVTHDVKGERCNKKFTIGYIADFNERKDIERFISLSCLALPADETNIVLLGRDVVTKHDMSVLIKTFKDRLTVPKLAPVISLTSFYNDEEVRGIIKTFDLYVSTSRGEGFNLPLLQALSMEKQCLVPAHTAHIDYVTHKKNGYLYNGSTDVVRTSNKNPWYHNDQVWGSINEIEYIVSLQSLFKEYKAGKLNDNEEGRKTVVNMYGKEAIKKRIQKCFSEIN